MQRSLRARQLPTRSIQCENLGYEEEDDIEELEGSQWDLEIDEDEIAEIEPDDSFPKLNVICLVGRLGADPVFKVTRSGTELCTCSIAVAHDYDPTDTDEDKTSWFDVEIWGNTARLAAKARRGFRVGLTGSLGVNYWTGRDGVKREDPVVRANTFEILQSRSESVSASYTDNTYSGGKHDRNFYSKSDSNSDINVTGNLRDLPF